MQTSFDAKAVIQDLKPFDLTKPVNLTPGIQDYLDYYQINFSKQHSHLTHHFGYVETNEFNIACHYFSQEKPKGTIIIMHGYFDHVGIFRHIIKFCLEKNYSVLIFDLPGHGLSGGTPASIKNFSDYTNVFIHMLGLLKKHGIDNLSVIAQSTGAAITMDYLISSMHKEQSSFNQLIFLAPLVRPFQWRSTKLLYYLLRPFIKKVKRKFSHNSHDQSFLDFLKHHDPLQPRYIPIAWISALKCWIKTIEKTSNSSLKPTIIQGGNDFTVDWRLNLEFIKTKFNDPLIYLLPEARHQLVNESELIRTEVFTIIGEHLNNGR